MANVVREAALRIRLFSGDFQAGLRGLERDAERTGHKMGAALRKPISAGWGAAKESVKGFRGEISNTIKSAATLGGAVSLGMFVSDALRAEEAAGKIAFKLRRMGDEGADSANVLQQMTEEARRLSMTTEETLAAYEALLAKTGEAAFSKEALDSVSLFQNAFRITSTEAADLVGLFREKLGATTQEISGNFGPVLMDVMNSGGLATEDLIANGDKLLATMSAAGLKGGQGFAKMIGILNATDDAGSVLEERMGGLKNILIRLQDTDFLQSLTKEGFGGSVKEIGEIEDSFGRLQAILSKKGGFESLQKIFGSSPKTAVFFKALTAPFEDARDKALKDGKTVKDATLIGWRAFDTAMKAGATTVSTEADLRREAMLRNEETSRKFSLAIDRMKQVFVDERMLRAMDSLGKNLPAIAEGFAKLVNFAVENPKTAIGAAIAAKIGIPAAAAALGAGAKSVAGAAATGLAGGASTAAAGVAGGAVTLAGGALAAAGAGALTGDQIRRRVVDPNIRHDIGAARSAGVEMSLARSAVAREGGSMENKQAALAEVRAQQQIAEQQISGWTGFFGELASMLDGASSPEELRREQVRKLAEEESRLTQMIERSRREQERVAGAAKNVTDALTRMSTAARNSTRGPAPIGAVAPGSDPVGG